MKRYKLLILAFSLVLIVCLNNGVTYSYFSMEYKSETQSIILGNLKIDTDNTTNNCWRYIPKDIKANNDVLDNKSVSGALEANNLRPGDGFEKEITITNTGSLNTKLKIKKGTIIEASPYKLVISLKEHDPIATVKADTTNNDTWCIENLKANAKVKFTVRLEVPTEISNKEINNKNIKLNNNVLELLDIVSTQWNNPTWSE